MGQTVWDLFASAAPGLARMVRGKGASAPPPPEVMWLVKLGEEEPLRVLAPTPASAAERRIAREVERVFAAGSRPARRYTVTVEPHGKPGVSRGPVTIECVVEVIHKIEAVPS